MSADASEQRDMQHRSLWGVANWCCNTNLKRPRSVLHSPSGGSFANQLVCNVLLQARPHRCLQETCTCLVCCTEHGNCIYMQYIMQLCSTVLVCMPVRSHVALLLNDRKSEDSGSLLHFFACAYMSFTSPLRLSTVCTTSGQAGLQGGIRGAGSCRQPRTTNNHFSFTCLTLQPLEVTCMHCAMVVCANMQQTKQSTCLH